MAKFKKPEDYPADLPTNVSVNMESLAAAIATATAQAVEQVRPRQKTPTTRKKNTPWTPKDGKPKLKLKRKCYEHSLLINEKFITNEDVELLNKLRPGVYFNGHVTVRRRKDKGLDIDYPIRTQSQRLRLPNEFGVTSFTVFMQKLIEEMNRPKPVVDLSADYED